MCGRFASYLPLKATRGAFRRVNALINQPSNLNVAPGSPTMVFAGILKPASAISR